MSKIAHEFSAAVNAGDLPQAKNLLKKGVDLDAWVDDFIGPPIVLAVNAGQEEMTKWLLDQKVKRPEELLYRAAYATGMFRGRLDWLFEQLLAEGADVNRANDDGKTPLFALRDARLATLALDKGANPKHRAKDKSTALHHVARHFGSPALMELLLARGAEIDAKDRKGKTPLDWAKAQGTYGKRAVTFLQERMGAPASVGGSWSTVEEKLFAESCKAIRAFAKKHAKETFDRFMFDCNSDSADVLLGLHPADANPSWDPGSWKYSAIAELELDVVDLPDGQEPKPFMAAVCRTLLRMEKEDAFAPLKRSPEFAVLARDHDEPLKTAEARWKKARAPAKKRGG